MPELPEVQATVRGIRLAILGRRIKGLWTDWPKMLKDPLDQRRIRHDHLRYFQRYLHGKRVLDIRRRAKNILIELSGGKMMLIHQKMSGHLLIGKWRVVNGRAVPVAPEVLKTDPWNGYIRLIFYFDRGVMVGFSDLRRFGKVVIGERGEIEALPELRKLGPEPLSRDFDLLRFKSCLRVERRKIKQVLMDPFVIAGIGNIYSDEMLWRAKINPFRKTSGLKPTEISSLFRAMRAILKKAVKFEGTSSGDYRTPAGKPGRYFDSRLVYQRMGEPCARCGRLIKRKKLAGRSAHFCSFCQR